MGARVKCSTILQLDCPTLLLDSLIRHSLLYPATLLFVLRRGEDVASSNFSASALRRPQCPDRIAGPFRHRAVEFNPRCKRGRSGWRRCPENLGVVAAQILGVNREP